MARLMEGRNIIVTGGASGIGLATAMLLSQSGANVALVDLDEAAGGKALSQISEGKKLFHAVDVKDRVAVQECIEKVAAEWGRVDGLAHIAGINPPCPKLTEVSPELYESILSVNLLGTFNFNQAIIKQFIRQNEKQEPVPTGGYSIVNAGSMASLTGLATQSVYCASKHAILGLSRAAAKEYGPEHIRVNVVCPGAIKTPLLDALNLSEKALTDPLPLKRLGTAEDVAQIVMFLLSSQSSYVTGDHYGVDGGYFS
ncbi:NAD(P)-binding protein [Atractiella rhizophila]|nr:NAD(P)-binding protein [Atractiella rhizophila]